VDKGEPESIWSGQKTAALAVGGAGVIGLALGTIFGVKAIGKKSDADAACQPNAPNQCDAIGVALRHEEKSAGTISTISLVAGGVALAGGVVLFLTAPSSSAKKSEVMRFEVRPAVAGGDMGLTFRGSW
jgi:serine/threonine-protein kinase